MNYTPPEKGQLVSNQYPKLVSAIFNKSLPAKRKNKFYTVIHVDQQCIIFDANEESGKAIIPTEVAIEWIEAFESGLVYEHYSGKERKSEISKLSAWSGYCHGFTSHLDAIVRAYQNSESN